ncbi:MAG: hypothetical protein JXB14_02480 [Candidatus Altiarchaeota archaeon]|nr:hypothetical protein [Candidatus Altiarchaeota archaeon]
MAKDRKEKAYEHGDAFEQAMRECMAKFPPEARNKHMDLVEEAIGAPAIRWSEVDKSIDYLEQYRDATSVVTKLMEKAGKETIWASDSDRREFQAIRKFIHDEDKFLANLLNQIKKRRKRELGK